jgi:hypothetical protein
VKAVIRRDPNNPWSIATFILNDWWTGLTFEDRVPKSEIERAETRLGVRFPERMREWYALAGGVANRLECFGSPDYLLMPHELRVQDGVLEFCVENQDCCVWGVRTSDLGMLDPPVTVESGWIGEGLTFTEFITLQVVISTVLSAKFTAAVALDDSSAPALEEHYPTLHSGHTFELCGDDATLLWWSVKMYEGLRQPDGLLTVACRDRASIERLRDLVGMNLEIQHRSRYWSHPLTNACINVPPAFIVARTAPDNDVIGPEKPGVFPACHNPRGSGTMSIYQSEDYAAKGNA